MKEGHLNDIMLASFPLTERPSSRVLWDNQYYVLHKIRKMGTHFWCKPKPILLVEQGNRRVVLSMQVI